MTQDQRAVTRRDAQDQPPTRPPEPRPAGRPGRAAASAVLVVGAAAVVALLTVGGGGPQPVPEGLPDPGPVTPWALPLLGYLSVVLGVGCVGALVVPLLSAREAGARVQGAGASAVHAVRPLAAAWALVCLAQVALTYSDQFAVPLGELSVSQVWDFARQVDQGRALAVQAVVVAAVSLASRWVLSVREATWLLVVSVLGQLPPLFAGHSAASGSHDTAIVSVVVHVLAASVWVGGVIALWWHLADSPPVAGSLLAASADWPRGASR